MYIIRNKIRVICSNIRVGMEGGGPFSIGGSIFNMTPAILSAATINYRSRPNDGINGPYSFTGSYRWDTNSRI